MGWVGFSLVGRVKNSFEEISYWISGGFSLEQFPKEILNEFPTESLEGILKSNIIRGGILNGFFIQVFVNELIEEFLKKICIGFSGRIAEGFSEGTNRRISKKIQKDFQGKFECRSPRKIFKTIFWDNPGQNHEKNF